MDQRRRAGRRADRGAAAVEMAIVLPLLLLVLLGIVDLGRLLLAQAMVTNAAREGVRMIAMGYTTANADTRVQAALPAIDAVGGLGATVYVACPASPSVTSAASATVKTAKFEWLAVDAMTSLFGVTLSKPQPRSTATMRCLG